MKSVIIIIFNGEEGLLFKNKIFSIIFLVGTIITCIGILLPWIDTIFMPFLGIGTWGGMIVFALLISNVCCFFFVRKRVKLSSVLFILSGIITIVIVYPPKALVSDPFVRYGIGTYVTAIGYSFIILSGIGGLLQSEKSGPFEDH